MTKIEKLIQEYKNAYQNLHGKIPKVVRKGAWIYIGDSPTAHRSSALPAMTERLIEMIKEKLVPLSDEEYDIRKYVSMIKVDGKHIFRSTNLKEMQKAGKRIAKMASRVLNLMDEE